MLHQEAKHPREALTYYRTDHKFDRWAAVTYLIARTRDEFFVANWANADSDAI